MSIHDFVNKHSRMAAIILSKSARVRRLRKLPEGPRLVELKKMEDEIDPPLKPEPKPEPKVVVEPKEEPPKKTPTKTARSRRKKSLDKN